MAMVVRFLSGSLLGRDFEFNKDVVRVGDDPDADIRLNPDTPEDGGARNRVVEVIRDGEQVKIRSTGSREISAQGEETEERRLAPGEEIRFGAWGPIFVVSLKGEDAALDQITSPIPTISGAEDTARRRHKTAPVDVRTLSGERPVGPKTVHMMIQDALGKARDTDGGSVQRGTVFIREMVSETIDNATRTMKIGIALLTAALAIVVVAFTLKLAQTTREVGAVTQTAEKKVGAVRAELGTQVATLRQEREVLTKETDALTSRLAELEKEKSVDQQRAATLRGQIQGTEERRRDLESRLSQAMTALESQGRDLADQRARFERAESERQAREAESAKKVADLEAARRADDERRAAEAKAAEERAAAAAAASAPKK